MTVKIFNFTEKFTKRYQSAENFIFYNEFFIQFAGSVTDSNVSIPQPFLNSWKHLRIQNSD